MAYLSISEKDEDDYAITIYDFNSGESSQVSGGDDHISDFSWKSDEELIFRNFGQTTGRFSYVLGEKRAREIMPKETWHYILGYRRDKPDFAYAYFPELPWKSGRHGLALVNLRRQPAIMMGKSNDHYTVSRWLEVPEGKFYSGSSDQTGQLRIVFIYNREKLRAYHRLEDDQPWTELDLPFEDTYVLKIAPDKRTIYIGIETEAESPGSVYTFDTVENKLGKKIFQDPQYSAAEASIVIDYKSGELLGVTFDRMARQTISLSPKLSPILEKMQTALPGRAVRVYDTDEIGHRIIFAATIDRVPTSYFVYDLKTGAIQGLPAAYPWLQIPTPGATNLVQWKARDGLQLEGYLTLPTALANKRPLPMVVLAHGGPWVRDVWGYDLEVQLLASQGYAVFQPNYRGSSGFSWAVSKADDYAFRKMHEDVTDGVQFLVGAGVADAQRLAIMGGSFGGFLAVAGAAWEPELYQCAVTIVGVFDWAMMVKYESWDKKDNARFVELRREFGEPADNPDVYRHISPIHDVDQIKIPIYVSHGKYDGNVDADQSRALISALKKNHVRYESFFAELEGHGYYEMKARRRYYDEVIDFLAKNLK